MAAGAGIAEKFKTNEDLAASFFFFKVDVNRNEALRHDSAKSGFVQDKSSDSDVGASRLTVDKVVACRDGR